MVRIEVNSNVASKNGFLMAANVLKGVFLEKGKDTTARLAKLFPKEPRYGDLYGSGRNPAPSSSLYIL
jgi:hypothetical protein